MWMVIDRWENEIYLTFERWQHIIYGHPELINFKDEILKTVRLGKRKQNPKDPNKFEYSYPFKNLPFGFTHLNVVVKLVRNNFIVTAYGIRKKR